MNCPKCKEEMEQGFIADSGHGKYFAQFWHSGLFKRSFWGGIAGAKSRKQVQVQTWRCTGCGYLEAYAQ
jgi:predicted nucleic-acid-binding Zn-ribbon protein